MNKWIKRAVFINVLFIVLYAVADYALWMRIPADMENMRDQYGLFTNPEVEANNYLLFKYIRFALTNQLEGVLPHVLCSTSQLPNLPFAIFLVMILTNLFLLKKAVSEGQT